MQIYAFCCISATAKSNSLEQFIQSGRAKSIKKDILRFLSKHPSNSYTAVQLQRELNIKHRSSVCHPLLSLIDLNLIEVVGTEYDNDTHREVSLYQLSKAFVNV